MRRTCVALALGIFVLLVALPTDAFAQAAKTARGTVTAMAGDSLTIKAADQPMTFTVDGKTTVQAYGAGTKDRAAQAAGNPGPKLADVIKVGQAVEVSYHDVGGKMQASMIRAVSSAGGGSAAGGGAAAAKMSSGTVESVSATSMTITGSSGAGAKFTQTFNIDGETKVIGRGAGTAAAAAGGKVVATDLVAKGDRVSVSYHPTGSTLHAAEIRVTAKGGTK